MKALTLLNPSLTKEILLRKADEPPGAWIGIRIAGLLLILSGWKSPQVAELFGLTRWAVVKWIRKANSDGVETVTDRARSGRPPRLDEDVGNFCSTRRYLRIERQSLQRFPCLVLRGSALFLPNSQQSGALSPKAFRFSFASFSSCVSNHFFNFSITFINFPQKSFRGPSADPDPGSDHDGRRASGT
jgi:hypothetical protein